MVTYPVVEKKYFLAEKVDATPEVLVARFKPEDGNPWAFDPGMFMMISGVDLQNKKYIGRAFSIASDPSSVDLEFFIVKAPLHPKVVPTTQATTVESALAQQKAAPAMEAGKSHFMDANIDDVFMMKGPSGQFRFDPAKDRKVLFIAGGTGLAPFFSMLRHLKAMGSDTDVKMLYSIKYPTEIILKDELEQLVQDLKVGMTITVTRPAPGDGWTGATGHINDAMIKTGVPDVQERMCYICGPLAFVKAVKDALTALAVQPQRVSADVWG